MLTEDQRAKARIRSKRYRDIKKIMGGKADNRPGRGNRHTKRGDMPFIGVDGEGGNVILRNGEWISDPNPRAINSHHYLLLRAGNDVIINPDRSPLNAQQCLSFLADLPQDFIYVAYFFTYDVTMILRSLPADKVKKLFDRKSRAIPGMPGVCYPVEWNGFEFDFMTSKHFKVRRVVPKGNKPNKWVTIHDVGSFFQCAFLKALKLWGVGTAEQLVNIGDGKQGRINFGALEDETIKYNSLECELLVQLMDKFRDACRQTGYVPRKYEGPGYSAAAMLDKHGVIRKEDLKLIIPDELAAAANASYFGGRFEITAVGPIPGPVYQHDINSAYPYSETKLPCLIHGQWERRFSNEFPKEKIWLAYGKFERRHPNLHTRLYGLPVRRKNNTIFYPASGEGWYWCFEVRAASFYQKFTPQEIWVYKPKCACSPMEWMHGVYEERSKLGKEGKGMVVKLAANSTYGKMCQSIGNPPYANPVWGSMITSMTRAQLYLKAIKLGGDMGDVVMLATDGIFTTNPIDKDHSPREIRTREDGSTYVHKPLGEWDVTTYDEGIFIIQPGLYILPGENKPKTRGLPQNKVVEHADDFKRVWHKMVKGEVSPTEAVVYVPLRFFMSLRQASHINKLKYAGQWLEMQDEDGNIGKKMSFNWAIKRTNGHWNPVRRMLMTFPYEEGCVSKPYSKDIGAWFAERSLTLIDYSVMVDAPEIIMPEELDMEIGQ